MKEGGFLALNLSESGPRMPSRLAQFSIKGAVVLTYQRASQFPKGGFCHSLMQVHVCHLCVVCVLFVCNVCAGSLFGAASTPAFGSAGVFGAASTPATGSSLFGGSVFGSTSAPAPAAGGFSFAAPAAAAAPGTLAFPTLGQQQQAQTAVQPTTVGQQPYGLLQPLPQVNVPEHKVSFGRTVATAPFWSTVTSTQACSTIELETCVCWIEVALDGEQPSLSEGVGQRECVCVSAGISRLPSTVR